MHLRNPLKTNNKKILLKFFVVIYVFQFLVDFQNKKICNHFINRGIKFTCKRETPTFSLGNSSRVIGGNLESFRALVIAYSRRPKSHIFMYVENKKNIKLYSK